MRAARAARRICPSLVGILRGESHGGTPGIFRSSNVAAWPPAWSGLQVRTYTGMSDDDDNNLVEFKPQVHTKTYESLWQSLLSGDSPVASVKHWEAAGNKFTRDTLALTLQKLKSRTMFIPAIEILGWVVEEKPFELTEGDFAQLITLACRKRQFNKAEAAYQAVPPHLSKSPAFCALVTGYASWDMVNKAEFLATKETSPLPQTYSSLILMYVRTGRYGKIPAVYERMKEAGVEPNVITYVLLLKYKDRVGEIKGLNKEIEAALARVDLDAICPMKRTSVAGNMMNVYAMLGKLSKVEDIWRQIDQERILPEGLYVSALEALALLGEVRKAEKVAEMKPTNKVHARLFQALARHYAKQGNMRRAEDMLAKFEKMELVPSFGIYNHLVTGYLARNDNDLAASRMRLALKVVTDPRAVPSYAAVMGVLPVLAQQKDVVTAEQLAKRYKGWRDDNFNSELLKVFESAGRVPSEELQKELQRRIQLLSKKTRLKYIRVQNMKTEAAKEEEAVVNPDT